MSFILEPYDSKSVPSREYRDIQIVPLHEIVQELLHVFYACPVSFGCVAVRFDYPSLKKDVVADYERVFRADLLRLFQEFLIVAFRGVYEYEVIFLAFSGVFELVRKT